MLLSLDIMMKPPKVFGYGKMVGEVLTPIGILVSPIILEMKITLVFVHSILEDFGMIMVVVHHTLGQVLFAI